MMLPSVKNRNQDNLNNLQLKIVELGKVTTLVKLSGL